MKTVFILGAGASKRAGAPLMADFLERADQVRRTRARLIDVDAFDDVLDAIAELSAIHAKSYLDTENIETLFGAIEMGQLIGKFAKRDETTIGRLRSSLITLIVQTLEQSISFPIEKGNLVPPSPYHGFISNAKLVGMLGDKAPARHAMSFLTFNYDLCLDIAIEHAQFLVDYGLLDAMPARAIPLLKLHGSTN